MRTAHASARGAYVRIESDPLRQVVTVHFPYGASYVDMSPGEVLQFAQAMIEHVHAMRAPGQGGVIADKPLM